MIETVKYDFVPAILIRLFKYLGVNITNDSVDSTLRSHPNYPSILSIGDSLEKWNIENRIIKTEDTSLKKIHLPCIAHTKVATEPFMIITAIDADTVSYLGKNAKEKKIKREDFLRIWSRIIVLLATNERSGDPDFLVNRKKQKANVLRKTGFILLAACLSILPLTNIYTGNPGSIIYLMLILLFYVAGLILSVLLVIHELDAGNPLVHNICHLNKNSNCNAVLNSKVAKPFQWLSWSETGLLYFSGGLLAFLFARNNIQDIIAGMAVLSMLALPYILFSILYQGVIVKQWCLLCLGVQFTLAAIFLTNLSYQTITFSFDPYRFIQTALPAFLVPILLFYTFKPLFRSYVRKKYEARNFTKLKFDPTVFTALLHTGTQMSADIPDSSCLVFGNGNARHTLFMACSPLCNPCAFAHKLAGSLLKQAGIQLKIIFTTPPEQEHPSYAITKHLIRLYCNNKEYAEQALNAWFEQKNRNYADFVREYPAPGNQYGDQADLLIQQMHDWCSEVKITYTPTLFFDGYLLPDTYSISDLSYFINK